MFSFLMGFFAPSVYPDVELPEEEDPPELEPPDELPELEPPDEPPELEPPPDDVEPATSRRGEAETDLAVL